MIFLHIFFTILLMAQINPFSALALHILFIYYMYLKYFLSLNITLGFKLPLITDQTNTKNILRCLS